LLKIEDFSKYLTIIYFLFNQNKIRNFCYENSFFLTFIAWAFTPRAATLSYLRIAAFFFSWPYFFALGFNPAFVANHESICRIWPLYLFISEAVSLWEAMFRKVSRVTLSIRLLKVSLTDSKLLASFILMLRVFFFFSAFLFRCLVFISKLKNGGWTNCLPTPFQYPENNVSIYLLRTPPRFSSATRPLYFPQLLRYPFGRDYSATPIPLRREGKLNELLPRHQ